MKYIIIPYISLGLILSLAIGIEYNCEGTEMFPTFYGSPFIFKQESLRSSMEYFYSILGILGNILVWGTFLFLIDKIIESFIKKLVKQKWINIFYKIIICFLIAFTTLNIAIDFVMMGRGFSKDLNYWYWNVDEEAKVWGVNCEGKVITLRK